MKDKVLILAYHRVTSSGKDPMAISVDDFRAQMDYFQGRGYSTLTLEEFFAASTQGREPGKTFVITFDDGYRDNYIFAFPVLKLFSFRATFFLTTDFVGKEELFPWDRRKNWAEVVEEDLPLTWEQVYEMREYGMEFGSHTCSHRYLDELPEAEMLEEIFKSKRYLEQKFGSGVNSFCYPSGRLNQKVKDEVRRAGYLGAVVTPRCRQLDEDLYSLKRIGIYSKDSWWRFRLKISPLFKVTRDLGIICLIKESAGRLICRP